MEYKTVGISVAVRCHGGAVWKMSADDLSWSSNPFERSRRRCIKQTMPRIYHDMYI